MSDGPILVGRVHRTLRDVELLVCDYDSLSVETMILPAGSFFQPWTPQDHWRGEKVPITLSDQATGFDWGVSSANGHFLRWKDFFNQCEMMDTGKPAPPDARCRPAV